MFYYIKEFCKPYYQLMPVIYEKQKDGLYHKTGMGCRNANTCGISLNDCNHFREAPEIVAKELLYEKRIGE